ncbi:hypothetical protein Clacol_003279 [Clathrus columnatus]|uniref:FAD/NAD(P)-binding domain-containing protein n=1 Tax=Clathrus columnatus TaxID=1419009 RepID=A0AAV5A6D1_9AGAM|nr:hypothetical protein Clacol_003279 [Clathrus columnatus]
MADFNETIGIIGAGPAGLITAHTLVQDGYRHVQILTRDATPGGVWARERVYPGLVINNVHGEFRFSSLPMPAPVNSDKTGGRLTGPDMCNYLESFTDTYLKGLVRYKTEVLKIKRDFPTGWLVEVENMDTGEGETLKYSKIVLCTGGCSTPFVPESLSPSAAQTASFNGPVFHSSQMKKRLDSLQKHFESSANQDDYSVVIVGGGKSSQDMATYLTGLGHKVTVVFDRCDGALAVTSPLPDFIRKSRTNDEGVMRPDGFFGLVSEGKISLESSTRVEKFGEDERSVILNNGKVLKADALILATGYTSSWRALFDEETASSLGITRTPPSTESMKYKWKYTTLANPPPAHCQCEQWSLSIYRGIVPCKNINQKDFAVNGSIFTTNNGYVFEVVSHWISSYFKNDEMNLPKTVDEAAAHAERNAAWLRQRYPDMLLWANDSYSSNLAFWTWPQMVDELLEDMGLKSQRSGGSWFNWPFKVLDLKEIANLKVERDAIRENSKGN